MTKRLSQKGCKHHQFEWKISDDELKSLQDGDSLKASFISMDDEVDFFILLENPKLKKEEDGGKK